MAGERRGPVLGNDQEEDMMTRKNIQILIFILVTLMCSRIFAFDYTQHEDFGKKIPGDVVSLEVTPPGTVLTGYVVNPGNFIWTGGPAIFNGTIPPDFVGAHNGVFEGTYQPIGVGGVGGVPRVYTWQATTEALVIEVDLDVDSDNSGTIDRSDEEDEIEEDSPGVIVPINNDFDEGNMGLITEEVTLPNGKKVKRPVRKPVPDNVGNNSKDGQGGQHRIVEGDEELRPAILEIAPPELVGKLTWTIDSKIKVWWKRGNVWKEVKDIDDYESKGVVELFIEGISPGEGMIEVSFTPEGSTVPYTDKVKVTIVEVDFDLDVNADGDLDDAVDRVANYLPGYEGSTAKIQWNGSGTFTAPQEMKLVAKWEPSSVVFDEVIFEITSRTFILGFCMNSTLAPGAADDYSFAASGDDVGPKNGNISTGKATVPFYCKDFGGYCEVKVTCKIGGEVICEKILEIPKDENDNKISDAWVDDNYNGTGASWDDESSYVGTNGDGITRMEEYRGFLRKNKHARMTVALKELFIYRENTTYGFGDGFHNEVAWVEEVTADEMNGAAHDGVAGTRRAAKGPRIVNFWYDAAWHKVDQHGLWLAVLTSGSSGGPANWGLAKDNNGLAVNPPSAPEGRGRIEIYADNIDAICGPVSGTDWSWDASARETELVDDTIAHEHGHGVSINHHNGSDPTRTISGPVGYPDDWDGTGKITSGTYTLWNEGGVQDCVMRYNYWDLKAAIAGDLDSDGTTGEPGEAPDIDWTPTVPTAFGFCDTDDDCEGQVVVDDSDE